jgi:phosphotransferase system enzyme I (PtsI)
MKTDPVDPVAKETVLQGIAVSPGIAIGAALLLRGETHRIDEKSLADADVPGEIQRFREALDKTRRQIEEIQRHVQQVLNDSDARIFDAHLLIVDDKVLAEEVEESIRREKRNADFIFNRTAQRYIAALAKMPDAYIRERAADIRDVASRVISNLHGRDANRLSRLPGQRIIVAQDLVPSDTVSFDRGNVQAFTTVTGSRTSHAAIMARSMQIPAVVGLDAAILDAVYDGSLMIVDGFTGHVVLCPTSQTLKLYAERETRGQQVYADMIKESRLRPETLDGFQVQLAANLELPEDMAVAKRYGAAGIGLFRTEYLFANPARIPDEDQQFEIYRGVAAQADGQPVIVRSLDIGGDKLPDLTISLHELNPFLGCRAIRLWRESPEAFRTQLRAVLRASAFGDIKLMFPMVCCLEEVLRLRTEVEMSMEALRQRKISFNRHIKIGIMVETPSAALSADVLASHVDFFSIGTNDLVQYTLAVDRSDEKLSYLYQPSHPAILRLIHETVLAARRHGIWVSVCGEMAGDPRFTPLLLGLGVHELSMSPVSIGPVRRLIRRLRMSQAEAVAKEALACPTAEAALHVAETLIHHMAPDILSLTFRGE